MTQRYEISEQLTLPIFEPHHEVKIPSTRYQGSKAKLVGWIWENIKDLDFYTAIDIFGGTGVVAYFLKQKGKQVYYNDYLKFNYYIGLALIENNTVKLSKRETESILRKDLNYDYRYFVRDYSFADFG